MAVSLSLSRSCLFNKIHLGGKRGILLAGEQGLDRTACLVLNRCFWKNQSVLTSLVSLLKLGLSLLGLGLYQWSRMVGWVSAGLLDGLFKYSLWVWWLHSWTSTKDMIFDCLAGFSARWLLPLAGNVSTSPRARRGQTYSWWLLCAPSGGSFNRGHYAKPLKWRLPMLLLSTFLKSLKEMPDCYIEKMLFCTLALCYCKFSKIRYLKSNVFENDNTLFIGLEKQSFLLWSQGSTN